MLAKLSPPRLYQPIARERLFRLLDRREQQPVIWVSGPPGAGKSTLVASYLERREIKNAWIQLDAGDKDPATLFYYLRELASGINADQANKLPYLTADYTADLGGFARRYFRLWFDALNDTNVWVLDNCQEALGTGLDTILRAVMEELPRGKSIIVLSRTDVPACLARLRVMNLVATISDEDLRFTPQESQEFALLHGVDEPGLASEIATSVDGWAAGLAVMLATAGRARGSTAGIDQRSSREMLFDFFAAEAFDGQPAAVREFLLDTALLPEMSVAVANELTGRADAGTILDQLYRNQYFTTRRGERHATYQYHALFREFLIGRLEEHKCADTLAQLRGRAAAALEQHGYVEPAIDLFVQARQWPAATQLIKQRAERLLAQGRGSTVLGWLSQMPEDGVKVDPWLLYWRGSALLNVDPFAAERELAQAHAGFVARDDDDSRLVAALGTLWAITFQCGSFKSAKPWITELQRALELPSTARGDHNLTAWNMFMIWALSLDPASAAVAIIPRGVLRLRDALANPELGDEGKLQAGCALLVYAWETADAVLAQQVIAAVGQLVEAEAISPVSRCDYLCNAEGWCWFALGHYHESIKSFQRAATIAREHKLFAFELMARVNRAVVGTLVGAFDSADQEFNELSTVTGFEQFFAMRMILKGRALSAWGRGRLDEAYRWAAPTIEAIDACGLVDGCAPVRLDMAAICAEVGDFETAQRWIDEAKQLLADSAIRFTDAHVAGVEAYLALRQGKAAQAHSALRTALSLLRNPGTRGQFFVLGHAVADLFDEALEAGIETELVHQLIHDFSIKPPAHGADAWPRAVKICALGGFELLINGKPLPSAGRVHYRVLQLLKALVTFGGRDVAAERIADCLWPDADGDVAASNLRTTLHRLRRLLGSEQLIQLRDGKLSLNRELCWLDIDQLAILRSRLSAPAVPLDERACQRLLALYRGPLLGSETNDWISAPRAQLHAEYLALLRQLGQHLEAQQQVELAARVYEKALTLDAKGEWMRPRLEVCLRQLNQDQTTAVHDATASTAIGPAAARAADPPQHSGISPVSKLH